MATAAKTKEHPMQRGSVHTLGPFALAGKPSVEGLAHPANRALMRYSDLLAQLRVEPARERKLAILKELTAIAKEYYGHSRKTRGSTVLDEALVPVSKFIIRNIRDGELVSAAVEVLKRTGTRAQVTRKLDELGDAAKNAGAASRQALARAYFEFVNI